MLFFKFQLFVSLLLCNSSNRFFIQKHDKSLPFHIWNFKRLIVESFKYWINWQFYEVRIGRLWELYSVFGNEYIKETFPSVEKLSGITQREVMPSQPWVSKRQDLESFSPNQPFLWCTDSFSRTQQVILVLVSWFSFSKRLLENHNLVQKRYCAASDECCLSSPKDEGKVHLRKSNWQ